MLAHVVRIIAEASAEIRAEETYYRKRSVVAADAFLAELDRAFGLILAAPERWPVVWKGARKFRLRRYPHSVVYRIEGSIVRVIAVAHGRRRPEYWKYRQ